MYSTEREICALAMISNHITKEPDMVGQSGSWKGWRVKDENGMSSGNLGAWLLFTPGAHPMWNYWLLTAIHLRPIEGVDPAVIRKEGATHEIMCLALDPDTQPNPDVTDSLVYMSPSDLEHQLILGSDAEALRLIEKCVDFVLHQGVPLDTDYRTFWEKILDRWAEEQKGRPN